MADIDKIKKFLYSIKDTDEESWAWIYNQAKLLYIRIVEDKEIMIEELIKYFKKNKNKDIFLNDFFYKYIENDEKFIYIPLNKTRLYSKFFDRIDKTILMNELDNQEIEFYEDYIKIFNEKAKKGELKDITPEFNKELEQFFINEKQELLFRVYNDGKVYNITLTKKDLGEYLTREDLYTELQERGVKFKLTTNKSYLINLLFDDFLERGTFPLTESFENFLLKIIENEMRL